MRRLRCSSGRWNSSINRHRNLSTASLITPWAADSAARTANRDARNIIGEVHEHSLAVGIRSGRGHRSQPRRAVGAEAGPGHHGVQDGECYGHREGRQRTTAHRPANNSCGGNFELNSDPKGIGFTCRPATATASSVAAFNRSNERGNVAITSDARPHTAERTGIVFGFRTLRRWWPLARPSAGSRFIRRTFSRIHTDSSADGSCSRLPDLGSHRRHLHRQRRRH